MAQLAMAFDILAKDRASKTFKNVGDAAEKAGKKGDEFGRGMSKGIGIASAGLIGLGVAAVAGFGKMVKEGRESEKIGRLTAAVVKSTGGAAKISAKQVGDLATAISNKTGADDEAIQSASNLLLTFTNVRNEVGKGNDIFNIATQAATDMAAALGTEPKKAALQLGKALNDPIKGVNALAKSGVSFTKQQKEQINTLVDSGKTLDAQKIILAEVGKEFGGAAKAAHDPLDRLTVIAGNLAEKIGTVLLPYISDFADWVSDKAIPAVSDFVNWLGPKLGPAIEKVKDFVGDVVDRVKDFVTEFQNGEGAAGTFRSALEKVGGVTQNVSKWIGDNLDLVKTLTVAVLAGAGAYGVVRGAMAVVTGATKAYAVAQGILNAVLTANPIGIVIVAIAALAAGLVYAYQTSDKFRSYVNTAFSLVKTYALTLAKVVITAFGGMAGVWLEVVHTIITGASKAFGWIPGIGDQLKGASAEFGKFKDSANEKLDAIKNSIEVNLKTEEASRELEALHREFLDKGWTITAEARTNLVYTGNGRVGGGSGGGMGGALGRPVPQPIGTGWNGYPGHKGVDFLAPFGTPVHAPMSGTVIRDGWDTGGFGVHIRTRDSDGNYTILGHLSQEIVSVGQKIARGQLIGYTGSTGNSSGPHLHMERRHTTSPGSAYNFTSALSRSRGGPVWPGAAFAVGDNPDGSWNKTTEIFRPTTRGEVVTQAQWAQESGSSGYAPRMHPHDLAALGALIERIRPVAEIAYSSLDRALGTRLP